MESKIDEMIELGVIEPSISPYSSPIVLVPKKDGSVRFCIDFRKLNKVTEFDVELMPNMEEVINRMLGHRFYTQMDLCKGYWQLGLSKRSRPYTAFETPKGLFQFKTMPFSLVNAGASFCHLIRIVLQGLRNVDSFVDDMWIFTETWEKHLKSIKVSNGAKIRNRYNQVPHLTQDTNGKVTNSQKTPKTRAKRSALSQQVTTKHI